MAMRGGLQVMAGVLLLMMASLHSRGVVQAQETFEEVVTQEGETVLFGTSNTYSIQTVTCGVLYSYNFYFGNGGDNVAVRTDSEITMGAFGDGSRIYACEDGQLQLIDISPSGQDSLIRLRRVNSSSSDHTYLVQITEASPAVYVQFEFQNQGEISCTAGVAGTPILFHVSSNTTTTTSPRTTGEVVPPHEILWRVAEFF